MRIIYEFQSQSAGDLYCFTDERSGSRLPAESGPWVFVRELDPDREWPQGVSRAVVSAGVLENGFYLWDRSAYVAAKPPRAVVESDRIEGTAVYDPGGKRIGSIKRLIIEKASGKVLSADVTFGGFLGLGQHHHSVPWEKLRYDTTLGGYRTDVTAEEVRAAEVLYGDEQVWRERTKEPGTSDLWRIPPSV
jgi:hypothetical protein